tara:strand:+ start:776 stop:1168 length:393 start_codon:yes stop_codon:yes gene_type:complete
MRPRFEQGNGKAQELLKAALDLEARIAKKEGSQPDYSGQKEGSTEGSYRFETQPGQVPNAFYNTNNVPTEVEDVKNEGASSEKSNVLDKPTQFPDAYKDQTKYRINESGGDGPTMTDVKKSVDRLSSRLL